MSRQLQKQPQFPHQSENHSVGGNPSREDQVIGIRSTACKPHSKSIAFQFFVVESITKSPVAELLTVLKVLRHWPARFLEVFRNALIVENAFVRSHTNGFLLACFVPFVRVGNFDRYAFHLQST